MDNYTERRPKSKKLNGGGLGMRLVTNSHVCMSYLLDISWFDDLGKCWMAVHSCYLCLVGFSWISCGNLLRYFLPQKGTLLAIVPLKIFLLIVMRKVLHSLLISKVQCSGSVPVNVSLT